VALPSSFLSALSVAVVAFLRTALDAGVHDVKLLVGPPAEGVSIDQDKQRLSLFFYRLEPSGATYGLDPDEPWPLRVHLLVTALGVPQDSVSAGENDLRLLGEVVRAFHEAPVLPPLHVGSVTVRPQAVLQPLSVEMLSHLWATQRDMTCRPSVAYELALVPVVPEREHVAGPLVGAVGVDVEPSAVPPRVPPLVQVAAPPVVRTVVATQRRDWAPVIAFVVPVESGAALVRAVSLAVGSAALAGFVPAVWVAGEAGAPVTLRWQVWDRADGWRPAPGGGVAATAAGPVLDPATVAQAVPVAVPLPFTDVAGQATLHATRDVTRPDGVTVIVRSDPLLVSLYVEGPP
jgi:hypothetical protein